MRPGLPPVWRGSDPLPNGHGSGSDTPCVSVKPCPPPALESPQASFRMTGTHLPSLDGARARSQRTFPPQERSPDDTGFRLTCMGLRYFPLLA